MSYRIMSINSQIPIINLDDHIREWTELGVSIDVDPLALVYWLQAFEIRYLRYKGNEFQNMFSDVMEHCYPSDFMRVQPWGNIGDRKNDGCLRSKRMLFQVYAPKEMKAYEAVKKIEEDFAGALQH